MTDSKSTFANEQMQVMWKLRSYNLDFYSCMTNWLGKLSVLVLSLAKKHDALKIKNLNFFSLSCMFTRLACFRFPSLAKWIITQHRVKINPCLRRASMGI